MNEKHGDERNRKRVYEWSSMELDDGTTLKYPSHDGFYYEKFCGYCREWIPVKGIVGYFQFEADHRHGEK